MIQNKATQFVQEEWLQSIVDTIKKYLYLKNKKQFILNDEKLSRFFLMVRLFLQDSIDITCKKNYMYYINYFKQSLPKEVRISEDLQVENIFARSQRLFNPFVKQLKKDNSKKLNIILTTDDFWDDEFPLILDHHLPLLSVELVLNNRSDELLYNYNVDSLQMVMVSHFQRVITGLSQVKDPEFEIISRYLY